MAIDLVELRKQVWRAVRQLPFALNMTDEEIRIHRQGLVVFAVEREIYCDGRIKPETVQTRADGKQIVFLPFGGD